MDEIIITVKMKLLLVLILFFRVVQTFEATKPVSYERKARELVGLIFPE